ncbi:MAG: DoxX family protein, partial [Anaerolineae bacterium]|nr:DoxX family protein [Anaerolineae bacterium]
MSENVLDPEHAVKTERGTVLQDPPLAQFLFSDTRLAAVWLVIRVLLGWGWLSAGLEKLGNPAWMETGEALRGFWTSAVQVPESGRPPIAFDWYRNFIQGMLDAGSYIWFAKLVTFGEIIVGVALILGLFVGVAAFLGAFMNFNYIMAGSASSNGLFGLAAILLILAWKTAGYYGLDRWILRRIGMTWQPQPPVRVRS